MNAVLFRLITPRIPLQPPRFELRR